MAPYCVDPQVFRPIPDREAIRRECGLPDEAIVVGNFHRDSEGADLGKPKAQKGPDIFLEVVKRLHRTNPRVTVLLAGPRRHWLREELKKAGIPYYFAGVVRDGDDYEVNILGRERLNQLYQALDLCLISSRWEGGPYSVLEAVFSGCPVVSTPVGMARDVLPEACIFRTVEEAVTAIETGVSARRAAGRIVNGRESALKKFALPELRKALLEIYQPFPRGGVSLASAARSCGKGIIHQFDARWRKSPDEPQITKATPAEGLLPVETPLDKGPNREFLNQIASDIAWFRN
jgi:glycosyltransferase involved in cell wall biosynthesis